MATTKATAVVKGGFWPENGVSSLTSVDGKGYVRRTVARLMGVKGQRKNRKLLYNLTGVVAGAATSVLNKRIVAAEELGGARAVENETLVSRVTAAADVTELVQTYLTYSENTYDPTPVANLDGNPLGTR